MHIQKFKQYKPITASAIVAGALAVVAMPSLAYGQTNTHPVFVTIANVEEIVAEAVANLGTNIDQLVSRMDANESADEGRDVDIAALQGQVEAQQQLMASQSAQLAELDQTIDAYESRIAQLELLSHEKTAANFSVLMGGSLSSGRESLPIDLTDYDVATFEINTSSGSGIIDIAYLDPDGIWKITETIHASTDRPTIQHTLILRDTVYKVMHRGESMSARVSVLYY